MTLRTEIFSRIVGFGIAAALALAPAAARAAPEMKSVAEVAPEDGVIHEGFAFADGGARLAYARTDAKGKTHLHVGPPGGKTSATEISSFTHEPEKILFVGGHWFVVANEGATRRAAVVGPTGTHRKPRRRVRRLLRRQLSRQGVRDRDRQGRNRGRPRLQHRRLPAERRAGGQQARDDRPGRHDGGHGRAGVRGVQRRLPAGAGEEAGRYDAKADVRGGTQMAVLDVLSGKTGPGKDVTDIPRFLTLRRQARPRGPAWRRSSASTTKAARLELVGPGDKLRPLALPTKFSLYEPASLQQQAVGGPASSSRSPSIR